MGQKKDSPMSKFALLCTCGIAASVFAADGVNTGRPVETSFRTSGIKAPVHKYDSIQAGPISQRDIDNESANWARKTSALAEQVARASNRAAIAPAATPNFFYFDGVAIPLNLKPQMALIINAEGFGNQRAIAIQALAQAGIAITPDVESMTQFVVVNLPQVAKSTEEMRTLIDRVLATGLVSFAAPVFDNELIQDGNRIPTPQIMIRADLDESKTAAMPPSISVVEAQIGPTPGVSQLRSSSQNGFDVMAQANMMQTAPGIRWAHVDFAQSLQFDSTIPNDPLFDTQWQFMQNNDIDMDAQLAWDFGIGNSAVRIGVLDSGIQLSHPDINAISGRNFTTGAVGGVGTGDPIGVCDNHGTSVAGCISAHFDNTLGGTGGAPQTTCISARLADHNNLSNCGSWTSFQDSWLVNAINYMVGRGVGVTNSSFSIGFAQSISDAYSTTSDTIVHCAASGNDGQNGISFPSSVPGVTCCGGFNSSGNRYGNWGTGLDVVGPAVNVPTTDRTGTNGYGNGDYVTVSGTSFATPLTSSVAALLLSEFPFATAAEVRGSFYFSAVDVGAAGYDTDYGYGRINSNNALLYRAPSNYDCSHATTIPAVIGSFNPAVYSTRWALNKTIEPFESCESGDVGVSSCVYYRFTPPYTGLIGINTNGSDYDTVLSIFESCTSIFGNPTQIACDDDGGDGLQSQLLNIPVTYGNQIIIKVARYGMAGGGGNLDFNFQYTSTNPTNDFCGNAIVIPISGLTDSYTSPVIDTQLATTSSCENDESCGAATNSKSVWWKFTAPYSGTVNLDTELSDFDTILSVFPECASQLIGNCIRYSSIACDDDIDGANNRQSRITGLNVNAGEDYLVKVGSFSTTTGGGARLRLAYTMNPPANDDCADAATIPSANTAIQWSSALVNARAATTESCQNSMTCGLNNVRSIWWEFTPPRDGRMNLNTVGSNYDTVLSAYAACARLVGGNCLGGSQLACNDDDGAAVTSRLTNFAVNGGTTYRFNVSAYNNGAAGDGKLNIQWTADCPADWNDDDVVDFFDYLDFLTSFNSGTLAGDFNDDQVVDFFDYLDFVNEFSSGC